MFLRRHSDTATSSKSSKKTKHLRCSSAVRAAVQALEPRVLLTTLTSVAGATGGGDLFEFQDAQGNFERIKLNGNITAEIIGAEVDPVTNRVQLIDMPGMLSHNGQVTAVNGGILTPQGAQIIGTIPSVVNPTPISALATDPSDGSLYALLVFQPQNTAGGGGGGGGTTQNPNQMELLQLNKNNAGATVIAEISAQVVTEAGARFDVGTGNNAAAPQVTGATAAAFNPIDGRLYFVAIGGQSNIPVLMSIDVHSGSIATTVVSSPGTFGNAPPVNNGTSNVFSINAMTWDQTGPGTARLLAARNPSALAIQNAAAQNRVAPTDIFQVNLANTNAVTGGAPGNGILFSPNMQAQSITGLAIHGDNPNAPDTILYGTVAAPGGDVVSRGGGGAAGGGGATGGTTSAAAAASSGPGTVIQIHLPGFTIANPPAASVATNLNSGAVDANLIAAFFAAGVTLSPNAQVAVLSPGNNWSVSQVVNNVLQTFPIARNSDNSLSVTGNTIPSYVTGLGLLYTIAQPTIRPANAGPVPIETSPGDLTYNPTMIDPFTNTLGALVATDAVTGDLFFVATNNRAPNDSIYSIYVVNSDTTGSISVGQVGTPPASPGNPVGGNMTPFAGSIGTIRWTARATTAAPGGTGVALLGARTLLIPGTTGTENIPILSAILDNTIGQFPVAAGQAVGPGLFVAQGQTMGKFLFGGTVTGNVSIPGSIDEFYAGWLLTGNALNTTATPASTTDPTDTGADAGVASPGNFSVGGDIRNLIVKGPIGVNNGYTGSTTNNGFAAPTYTTGFDLVVGGSIGEVRAGGSIVGNIHAFNNAPASLKLGIAQEEAANPGWRIDNGLLGGDPFLNDNNFNTPQILGTIPTTIGGPNSAVLLNGELQATLPPPGTNPNDFADYYGIPLLAGQTVTAQVTDLTSSGIVSGGVIIGSSLLHIGVFDPDGRLIATDYNDAGTVSNVPVRFTADKPGVYRIAVATEFNTTFQGTGTVNFDSGTFDYTLQVQNVGNLGIGGIFTDGTLYDNGSLDSAVSTDPVFQAASFATLVGDIGGVVASTNLLSANTTSSTVAIVGGVTFDVPAGNLRSIEAGSMGLGNDTGSASFTTVDDTVGPTLNVPNGSVGLLNAIGNGQNNCLFINPLGGNPIGGDYQVVSTVGSFDGELIANKGIGVLRCADMNVTIAPILIVDADNRGADGTIGLIDVTNQMGTLAAGGPHITTGDGGNVGYIHVGGAVYRDYFFGTDGPEQATVYSPGLGVTVTDDSGSLITITPIDNTTTTTTTTVTTTGGGGGGGGGGGAGGGGTGGTGGTGSTSTTTTTTTSELSQLTLLVYPIAGSGGVAIISAVVAGSVDISTHGDVPGQTAEIGSLTIEGTGTTVVASTVTTAALLGGNAPTTVVQPATPVFGVTPQTTGTTGGTGGTTTTTTVVSSPIPTLVTTGPAGSTGLQMSTAAGALPLFAQFSGAGQVNVYELIVDNFAGTALGNATVISNTTGGEMVNISAASIGQLISNGPIGIAKNHTGADLNGVAVLATVGNQYPFVQQHHGVVVNGNLLSIQAPVMGNIATVNGNIGEVVATAGGLGIVGPIFAFSSAAAVSATVGNIDSVQIGGGLWPTGSGSVGLGGLFADGRIGTINGTGADIRGNIISANGIDSIRLKDGSIINNDIAVPGAPGNEVNWAEPGAFLSPANNRTVLSSNGSPIDRATLDIGSVSISGNGGIIGMQLAFDHMGSMNVTGYGIFSSVIHAQVTGTIGAIRVGGYGIRNTTIEFGNTLTTVSLTNHGDQLPVSDYSPSVRQSINGALFDPYFGTPPSLLTDLDLNLGTTAANPFNGTNTTGGILGGSTIEGGKTLGTVSTFAIQGATINVGSSIGTISSISTMNSLTVITGKLKSFQPGADVSALNMQIAGKISSITIHGNLNAGSVINAKGVNGNIGNITVTGNLNGTITAHKKISSINVGGNLTGLIDAPNINKITFNGSLQTGTLEINGNVGTLNNLGDFGTAGQTFIVHGSMKKLNVTGNYNVNTTIEGNLKSFVVLGSVTQNVQITIDRALNSLFIGGDLATGSVITAHPLPPVKKQKILGQILGSLVSA